MNSLCCCMVVKPGQRHVCQKELDGCYFGMPRMTFNIHWSQHVTNSELWGEMPELSDKIRERRMLFTGHCYRSKNEPVSRLINWLLKDGVRKSGKSIDVLTCDTGLKRRNKDYKIGKCVGPLWTRKLIQHMQDRTFLSQTSKPWLLSQKLIAHDHTVT